MAGIIKTSINLTAIPKDKIIVGKKGKYMPIAITMNDEPDQFNNQGYVTVDQTREERESKAAKTYLGNVNVVWTNDVFPQPVPRVGEPEHPSVNKQAAPVQTAPAAAQPVDDLPF